MTENDTAAEEPTNDEGVTNVTPAVEGLSLNGEPDDTEERTPDDKEAARYRRRLRETESERDGLAERLQVIQRGDAERIAASKMADPADLWRDGAQLADVLDDAGQVDTDLLDGLIGTVLGSHPHWRRQVHPAAAPASEVTARGKIEGGGDEITTWSELLNQSGGRA
jgi:hypothetical protein